MLLTPGWGQDCIDGVEVELWGVCYNIEEADSLDLSYSELSGPIPTQIGLLSNLTYLSLFQNDLTGEIPLELGNLSDLTYLSLTSNDLEGAVPSEIANLTNLIVLSLGFNDFTSIPENIGELSNLGVLFLRSNQIQSIPESVGYLSNLQEITFEFNQIQSIPESIGNLTDLKVLNFSYNDIDGEIPASIGTLTNLSSLHLDHNQLSGGIPDNFCDLENILFLNLSSNNLCPPYPVCVEEYVGEQDTSECVVDDNTLLVPSEYLTIQEAIDAAVDGDSVLVSAGTYFENIVWPPTNGIKLIGSGEDDCFIDGDSLASVIRFEEDLGGIIDSTTLITGFTIQNGYAQGYPPNSPNCQTGKHCYGGGICLYDSSPTLTDITISGNDAIYAGGGMALFQYSSPTLTNVMFSDNDGGGMYAIGDCNSTLTNVTFSDNVGAGMYFSDCNPTLTNVTFSDNVGAGIAMNNSSPTLTNVTFSDNGGGGIRLGRGNNATLINSILWNNPPEISFDEPPPTSNSITIIYSDIQGGEDGIVTNGFGTVYYGDGNIDEDPLFCDAENNDFTVQSDSPVLGAGQDGADMGAYGVGCGPSIFGCTDSEASNYAPDAKIDDGSCCIEIWDVCYNIEETDSLDLSGSGLIGEIPSEIGRLINLIYLNLHYNQLTGEIPSEIDSLTNLTYLSLSDNQLTGEIPSEIGNLTNLTHLHLHLNEFTGEIPVEIRNLTNLIQLHLSHNQLTGEIPHEIGQLTNLIFLGISYNQLTGEIPVEIGNMTSLIQLRLGTNQLTGEIPSEIGQLTNLTSLNLNYNQLTGEIPVEIGNMTSLIKLRLYTNQLTGKIPSEIDSLTNLTYLSLSDNQLTGEIPSEIGNLANLEYLLLFNNQLTGKIPEDICDLNIDWGGACDPLGELQCFNSSHNHLCPPYPECLVNQEPFMDGNHNGIWDEDEPFEDTNENGIYEEDYVGEQDTSECGECNGEVSISNQWSDGYHYEFTYTLGAFSDYQGQALEQIAQREITNLIVTCQETGQIWSFDSEQIGSGNGNHNSSYLQGQYDDFPLPTRDISNGVLIGIDTYSTGNYHSLWFSVTAIDEYGNEFTHDNYVDTNPYGWNPSNEITFTGLNFSGVVDYANFNVLYAEGAFPVADITYQIGEDGYYEGFVCDENCEGSLSGSDCENSITIIDLHVGSNLISFSVLSEDNTVGNVLSPLGNNAVGLSGEGEAALNTENGWIGSLTTLLYENGYWLLVNEAATLNLTGISIQSDQLYALNVGNNLISYPLFECGNIEEVLLDEVEDCIDAIAGEGVAALNTNIGWVGSLTELCQNDGYWFVSDCEINFTYDEPQSLARKTELSPSPYPYSQSSKQAFYFIESVEKIEIGDWILSFNGGKVIGAREWSGKIIDVPAMGDDGSGFTAGYIQTGQIPTFKLLKDGMLINLEGDIPAFQNNQLYMVASLSKEIALPETFSLDRAYPNPFNPVTTLRFALPIEAQISLTVYNLQGREVISLVNGNMEAGYHSVVWNADSHSSGMYFIKMVAGDYINTQKLMLVK